ncbi:MAG: DMT family transporter [Deltaproteobacteria bacterium]|nr:DMT family transporter [Deltaproteobacteria bacterium]
MNKHVLRADWLLLLTAVIWGCAFVAQHSGMRYMGPFTFNGIRFTLGGCALIPLIMYRNRRYGTQSGAGPSFFSFEFIKKGLLIGSVLFCGASLQQTGMVFTSAGKGGFITGLYVILVPIIGLFLGHRLSWSGWAGAILATSGMYLLSVTETLTIESGDLWVLASAFFWASHVLILGWLSPRMDTIKLACAQFLVCAALSLITAAITEPLSLSGITDGILPILYGGLMSVGIAYTLQVVAQKDAPPAHASIILSLETVFAAISGWILLDEYLTLRAIIGCVLMLAGMFLVQLWPASIPKEVLSRMEPRTADLR